MPETPNEEQDTDKGPFTFRRVMRFLLPSLIGVMLFLVPISHQGNDTILMGVITDLVRAPFEAFALEMVVVVIVISVIGSGYYLVARPDWRESRPALHMICHSTPAWFVLRLVGALFGVAVLFQVGPEIVWGEATGVTVFNDIGVTIFFILGIACILLPFLTDYGFLEFVGTLARKPFEALFRLPGRSAIDATASFVAASTVGLLITINQYDRGYYSAREAASVATNFSIVSIPFSLVIAKVSGLESMFFTWYMVVIMACILCALITVRIPPLSRMPDTYKEGVEKQIHEDDASDQGLVRRSLTAALERADNAPGPFAFLRSGGLAALDVIFGVLGPSMALATLTAILVFHTPVFEYLAYPVYLVLEVSGLPEAKQAAPGFLIGFLDQFMPALVAQDIPGGTDPLCSGWPFSGSTDLYGRGRCSDPAFQPAAQIHGSAADFCHTDDHPVSDLSGRRRVSFQVIARPDCFPVQPDDLDHSHRFDFSIT